MLSSPDPPLGPDHGDHEMFGTLTLHQVRDRQDELIREADERRLAARTVKREQRETPPRRILGLRIRLSLA